MVINFKITKYQQIILAYHLFLTVESGEASSCRKCDYIKVSSRKGYLASSITYDSGCGSADCPWLIEGSQGKASVPCSLSYLILAC